MKQIEWAICYEEINPENIFSPGIIITELYQVEKVFTNKWSVPVVDPTLSFLNISVPFEDVPSFKDYADRKFGLLLNRLLTAL